MIELDWTSDLACHPAGPAFAEYDIIVGSDLAYDEDLFQPLLSTITAFTAAKPSTQVGQLHGEGRVAQQCSHEAPASMLHGAGGLGAAGEARDAAPLAAGGRSWPSVASPEASRPTRPGHAHLDL